MRLWWWIIKCNGGVMSRFLENLSNAVQRKDIFQGDENAQAYQKTVRDHLEKLGQSEKVAEKIAVLRSCNDFLSGCITYDSLLEAVQCNPRYKPSFFSASVMCGVPTEIEELVSDIVAFGKSQCCRQSAAPY